MEHTNFIYTFRVVKIIFSKCNHEKFKQSARHQELKLINWLIVCWTFWGFFFSCILILSDFYVSTSIITVHAARISVLPQMETNTTVPSALKLNTSCILVEAERPGGQRHGRIRVQDPVVVPGAKYWTPFRCWQETESDLWPPGEESKKATEEFPQTNNKILYVC